MSLSFKGVTVSSFSMGVTPTVGTPEPSLFLIDTILSGAATLTGAINYVSEAGQPISLLLRTRDAIGVALSSGKYPGYVSTSKCMFSIKYRVILQICRMSGGYDAVPRLCFYFKLMAFAKE